MLVLIEDLLYRTPTPCHCWRPGYFTCFQIALLKGLTKINLCFTDIRTFEILLRTYEVRDVALKSVTSDEACVGPRPQKRRMLTTPGENTECPQRISSILVRPCSSAKGHTGYLTFARLCV